MEIYVINTGYIQMKKGFYIFPGIKDKDRYPVLVYLIKVDGKSILFDTGISDINLSERIGIFSKFIFLEKIKDLYLPGQLNFLNIKTGELDYIINSHLHFDHCAGNIHFKSSPVFIQTLELKDFRDSKKNPMYGAFQAEINFKEIDGKYELYRNGQISINLLPAGGHSTGQQILNIETDHDMVLFLSDTCYMKDNELFPIEVKSMPNYTKSKATLDDIKRIITNSKKSVQFFLSHDLDFEKKMADGDYLGREIIKYVF